jgi:hypothetical protein
LQITGKRCNALLLSEGDWRAIQETFQLVSIAGMSESILDGMATCLSWSFLLTKQAQTHQYSAPVLRAAFAAILYCPVHGYFIGSQSLKQVAVDLAFSGVPTYHYDPILLLEPPPLQRRGRELGPQRLLRGGLKKEEANCLNCGSASGSQSVGLLQEAYCPSNYC